ncbi:4246_t:CDS:2, partial [Funneliformis geosporum]
MKRNNKSLSKNKLYVLAVSGGSDSMFLLEKMRGEGCNLVVAHVNYKKRENSDYDEKVVKDYCQKYSLPCEIHQQIYQYLTKNKIDYAVDITNQLPIYQRNIIRQKLDNLSQAEKKNLEKEIKAKNQALRKTKKMVKTAAKKLVISPAVLELDREANELEPHEVIDKDIKFKDLDSKGK